MNLSADTPPKGDYAAYIEQLMREAEEESLLCQNLLHPRPEAAQPSSDAPDDPAAPADPEAPAAPTGLAALAARVARTARAARAARAAPAAPAASAAPAAPAAPAASAAPAAPAASAAAASVAASAAAVPALSLALSLAAPPAPPAPPPPPPPVKTLLEALASIDFLGHAKWLVLGWFVAQLLDSQVPDTGLGLLFHLGVLGYVGWVMFTVNRSSGGALAKRMRELSTKAMATARKLPTLIRKKFHPDS